MRFRRALSFALAAWVLCGSTVVGVGVVHAQDREEARKHLKVGVKLYNEQNYEAALVQFEASFVQLPSASALQNIALCQTKLFRYVDAIETLEGLRTRFGGTMPAEEASQVEEALRNLSQLVGTVTLQVTPPTAKVKIGSRVLSGEELQRPLRMSSGEYAVEVVASNHLPVKTSVKIAGGETKTVTIDLEKAVGTLTVRVNDQQAAISMDRVPLAYGTWTGQVVAGEHLLQVYKPGHVTVSTQISVRTGDKMELQLSVGPPEDPEGDVSPGYDLVGLPYRVGRKSRSPFEADVGWYGLVSASNLAVLRSPDGFDPEDDADVLGGSFGLRGGYRLGNYVALEAMFDTGSQSVSGTFGDSRQTYDLLTRRYGANIRLLLGGKSVRLTGALGVGAAWHRLDLAGSSYAGTNSYLGMDLGPQFNVGQVLIDGVVQAYFEGASNTRDGEVRMYTRHTVLPQVGVGLRVGFSQWGTW